MGMSCRGWFGTKHTLKNPAKVKLDFNMYVGDNGEFIPAGIEHLQFESANFGWFVWRDANDQLRIAKW